MRAEAILATDDVYAVFSANMVQTDYGVPRSPTWWEPEDIKLESLEILGVKVPTTRLPSDLENKLYEMIYEEGEWE